MLRQLGGGGGGFSGRKEPLGQLIGAAQTVQQIAAKRLIRLAAKGRDPRDSFGGDGHLMGLGIAHHLQAMLNLAVGGVKLRQLARHRLRQPILCHQSLQSPQGAAVAQAWVAPACDQLTGLGEKLDLADAALTQFHIMAFNDQSAVQAAMLADAQAHVMGVLDGNKIQMLAPNKGGQAVQKPSPCRQITTARAGFDIGRTLPCTALSLVIGLCGGHRQAHRRHTCIGAQPQIGAKHIALRRDIGQHRSHAPRDPNETCPRLVPIRAVAVLIKQANQVDVRGIIQLARAHLAHGKASHPACGFGVLGHGPRQFATPNFLGHQAAQRQINGAVGKISQRAGHLHQRPDPAQIGQGSDQRKTAFGRAQGIGQRIDLRALQPRQHLRANGFGRLRQCRAQPVGLGQHQAA